MVVNAKKNNWKVARVEEVKQENLMNYKLYSMERNNAKPRLKLVSKQIKLNNQKKDDKYRRVRCDWMKFLIQMGRDIMSEDEFMDRVGDCTIWINEIP